MAVEPLAQVVLDPQREAPRDQAPRVRQRPPHQHRAEDRQRQQHERVAFVAARGQLVAPRVQRARLHRIDRFSCELRQRNRHHHRHARQHPRRGQAPLVWTKEAQ